MATVAQATALAPVQVLAQHARLHDSFARPSAALASFIRWFATDAASKERGAMFYPHLAPATGQAARDWCAEIARDTFAARTYQVTAEMARAVRAVHRNTQSRVDHLDPAELPAPAGFVWFDEPLMLTDGSGKATAHRALLWAPVDVVHVTPTESFPGVRISTWSYLADTDDYSPQMEAEDWENLASLGDLSLHHVMVIPFGQRFATHGADGSDSVISIAHTLWMFLDAEITVAARPPLGRAALRRTQRSLKQNQVTVVALRRAAHHTSDGQQREVDWSCRWLVQGHWRHTEPYALARHHAVARGSVCARCGARITWVRPHVRGPDDKPLKATRRLYQLRR